MPRHALLVIFAVLCAEAMKIRQIQISKKIIEDNDAEESFSKDDEEISWEDIELEIKNCAVCLEEINEASPFTTECKHTFHSQCIHRWVQQTAICPVCRQQISKEAQEKLELQLAVLNSVRDQNVLNPDQNVLNPNHQNSLKSFLRAFLWDLLVEAAIITSTIFLPKWRKLWFPWMQGLHAVSLTLVLFCIFSFKDQPLFSVLRFTSLSISYVVTIFTYHSAVGFLLNGFDLFSVILLFWFIPLVLLLTSATQQSENQSGGLKPSIFLSLLAQTQIILSQSFVPKWFSFFLWAQGLQAVSFALTAASPQSPDHLTLSVWFSAAASCFAYNSLLPFVFSGFNLTTAIFWYWIFLLLPGFLQHQMGVNHVGVVTRRFGDAFSFFVWLIVEVGVVLAVIFLPSWFRWFLWMQGLQIVSIIFNVSSALAPRQSILRRNNTRGLVVSLLTAILSYHSTTFLLFSNSSLAHATFWPWFVLSVIGFVKNFRACAPCQISARRYVLWYIFWSLLEAGLIVAKFYVALWADWFSWMQVFHGAAFFLAIASKFITSTRRKWSAFVLATFLLVIFGSLSYSTIMGFIFSGWNLFHALFWPILASTILSCVYGSRALPE